MESPPRRSTNVLRLEESTYSPPLPPNRKSPAKLAFGLFPEYTFAPNFKEARTDERLRDRRQELECLDGSASRLDVRAQSPSRPIGRLLITGCAKP